MERSPSILPPSLALQVGCVQARNQVRVQVSTNWLGYPTRQGYCRWYWHRTPFDKDGLLKQRELPGQVNSGALLVVGAIRFPKNEFLKN